MFCERPRKYLYVAVGVWLADMLALFVSGWLCANTSYDWYWVPDTMVSVAAVAIVWKLDHDLTALGLGRGHLRHDAIVMVLLLVLEYLAGVFLCAMLWDQALRGILYYVFQIALEEEIVDRGLIQNYLFGLRASRRAVFAVGAAMFALSHLPFQMQIRPWDLMFPLQLITTFAVHLVFCWVASKRNNVLIPLALHVALDFLNV